MHTVVKESGSADLTAIIDAMSVHEYTAGLILRREQVVEILHAIFIGVEEGV